MLSLKTERRRKEKSSSLSSRCRLLYGSIFVAFDAIVDDLSVLNFRPLENRFKRSGAVKRVSS